MADSTKRATAKSQFTRAEKRLEEALEKTRIPYQTIERRYEELREKYNLAQQAHDDYVQVLLASKTKDTTEEEEEKWIAEITQRYDDIEERADTAIAKMKKDEEAQMKLDDQISNKQERVIKNDHLDLNRVLNGPVNSTQPSSTLQLERIKLEKFNGDIRKYPKFKEQFELYIKPICTASQLPFILKSHLSEEVQEEVDNIDDNLDTLWARLDKKYGNRSKLVDTILADIAKAPRGDSRNTLAMIKVVEKAYRDLTRMGRRSEMENGTILSMIEKKLPEEIRFEWIKCIADEEDDESEGRFQLMLELLQKWAIRIEYDQAAIRKVALEKQVRANHTTKRPVKEVCWIDTQEKHPIWVCNAFRAMPANERIDLTNQNNACHACLEIKCPGADDATKCQRKFKCPVDGCREVHNKLLHQ